MASPPPQLIVWAPSSADTAGLPTLDAASLYAASLLRAAALPFAVGTLQPLLHARAPLLEAHLSAVPLAHSPAEFKALALAALDGAGSSSGSSSSSSRAPVLQAPQPAHAALAALLERSLAPALLHAQWFTPLFATHTFSAYAAGLSWPRSRSAPHRLRAALRPELARRMRELGLGEALQETKEQEAKERDEVARRAGIRLRKGLSEQEKRQTQEKFGEAKFIEHARSVLQTVATALGSDEYFDGASGPSPLDIQLFSLLAPLLLPPSYEALATSPLAQLLRSFPTLEAHTARLRSLLWPTRVAADGGLEAVDWPALPGDDVAAGPGVAYTVGHAAGSVWAFGASLPDRIASSFSSRRTAATQPTAPAEPPHVRAQRRRILWGRAVWIGTAIVGVVFTAFASGLLSIEFVDDEDDEDEGYVVLEEADGVLRPAQVRRVESDDEEELEEGEEEDEDEEGEEEQLGVEAEDGWEVQTEVDEEEELDFAFVDDDDE